MRPLPPISFTQPLETLSNDQRDELAVALTRAALRCVGDWRPGRVLLMNCLFEELMRLEEAERQEACRVLN
jgi:hypothetical protein